MYFLGVLFGLLVTLFVFAALFGFAIGTAVGIARVIRNPASLLTGIKSYFAARRI